MRVSAVSFFSIFSITNFFTALIDLHLSSHNNATVSAFIMNIFIAELNVFAFSSGPRQRNIIKVYINSKKSE